MYYKIYLDDSIIIRKVVTLYREDYFKNFEALVIFNLRKMSHKLLEENLYFTLPNISLTRILLG